MANNDEKILKALDALLTDIKTIKEVQQVHGKWLDGIENRLDKIDTEQKKQFKTVNKRLKIIEDDIKYLLKYQDELHINLRTRVEKIEDRMFY